MKNKIQELDRYYQSFISQKEDWNFFYLLADYVKYIAEDKETTKILDLLEEEEKNYFKHKDDIEDDIKLSDIFEKLIILYVAVFRFDEFYEMKKGLIPQELWAAKFEMDEIRDKIAYPNNKYLFRNFYRNHYEIYSTRIHNYLIRKLTEKELDSPKNNQNNKKKEEDNKKAKYENGILYFKEKEINFNNKQNQKDLLFTLFEEPKKNWSYDEIQGKWDSQWNIIKEENLNAKNYWKKFYSAGDDIKKEIAIETQIKDFIIKNTKEIKINPKYI